YRVFPLTQPSRRWRGSRRIARRRRLPPRPREGMRARKAPIDRDGLAVDVGRLVARQEERHGGDLLGLARALERVQLADLVGGAVLAGALENRSGHAGLDQAGADGVDADAGAGERVG